MIDRDDFTRRIAAALYRGWFKLHKRRPRGRWDKEEERAEAQRRALSIAFALRGLFRSDEVRLGNSSEATG